MNNGLQQQEAQEPAFWTRQLFGQGREFLKQKPFTTDWTPLYTAPQPAPAPLSDDADILREAPQRIEGASMSMYATRSDMLEHCQDIARAIEAEVRKQDDALIQQMLYVIEAWERGCEYDDYWRDRDDSITAARKRLERNTHDKRTT